jgi:transposase
VNELRNFLIDRSVNLVHIWEYKTSKTCCLCGQLTFKRRNVMYRNGDIYPAQGVLSCISCRATMGRDYNGAKNILHILHNYLHSLDRPSWLQKIN